MVVSFVKRLPKLNIVGAFANANEALAKTIDFDVFEVSKNYEGTSVVLEFLYKRAGISFNPFYEMELKMLFIFEISVQ